MSIGPETLIITQRQSNGSYRNYFGLQVPADFFRNGTVNLQDAEATRRLLLSDFYAGWSEDYKELIQHATDFRPWTLYSISTADMIWDSVPGVTLVGDAAHLAVPNGEGVNVAMEDALKLASKIAEHGIENLNQAVREYEADMFPRGVASITAGEKMVGAMFSGGPQGVVEMFNS